MNCKSKINRFVQEQLFFWEGCPVSSKPNGSEPSRTPALPPQQF